MAKLRQVTIRTRDQWRKWLKSHHRLEEKVFLISYKKHTGKKSISHREQIEEAICFGWIDTTVKKIDEDRYGRYFVKRKKGATWSRNTLSYGAQLLKEGKMSSYGKEVYLRGKKKKPIDHNIPTVFTVPTDLKRALSKNRVAKSTFEGYPPSAKKMYLKWLFQRREKRQG